jgi:hypothetical protein
MLKAGMRCKRHSRPSLANSASKHCMQCPEYEKLWTAYIDAASGWREILQTPSLSVYATGLRRHATVLKHLAKERAAAHKRKCLLCANIRAKSA